MENTTTFDDLKDLDFGAFPMPTGRPGKGGFQSVSFDPFAVEREAEG